MIYEITAQQFTKMLKNLDSLLLKAEKHAEAKKFDMSVLLGFRLAPDQFPLTRQIQIACDTAKMAVARLAGKEFPIHEDKETTVAQLHARIADVIKFLGTFSEKDFAGAAERKITTPRWEGKYMFGHEFATQHAIPNLYFHVATAYSILRHNGVDVGKKDYLGEMPMKS